MQKYPDRPKIKYKNVKKPPPPLKTKEEIVANNVARLESQYHITPLKVNAVIAAQHGLLTRVCDYLKMPRSTLMRYIDKHPECIEALVLARDAMGDKAEKKLFEKIEEGDLRAILYYLSTVQRSRGYGMNTTDNPENNGRGPVFVETVNIVGVPSGTFLPKEIASKTSMVIDNNE